KKTFCFIVIFLYSVSCFADTLAKAQLPFEDMPLEVVKKEPQKRVRLVKEPVIMPFYVFNNSIYPPIKSFAPSGYMGDIPDLKITGSYSILMREGYPALKVTYSGTGPSGWAGIMWQNPPNNWGEWDGGYNLTRSSRLTFWAKGAQGGETVEFKIGGTLSNYPDSDNISSGHMTLHCDWTEYTIDLSQAQLHYISAGFGFVLKQEENPEGCIFYLDDIKFEE
ncbi:MAG: hypothetical protein JW928_07155, partial [Candidatus Aureabacteria bacterium]|nr:hypothetical protein [Candidatus Auribacterota bacterium]